MLISDRLCFISFKILFISVIGISAKGHIGATLHTLAGMHMHNYNNFCLHADVVLVLSGIFETFYSGGKLVAV